MFTVQFPVDSPPLLTFQMNCRNVSWFYIRIVQCTFLHGQYFTISSYETYILTQRRRYPHSPSLPCATHTIQSVCYLSKTSQYAKLESLCRQRNECIFSYQLFFQNVFIRTDIVYAIRTVVRTYNDSGNKPNLRSKLIRKYIAPFLIMYIRFCIRLLALFQIFNIFYIYFFNSRNLQPLSKCS